MPNLKKSNARCADPPYGCGRQCSVVGGITGLCKSCVNELHRRNRALEAHVNCTSVICTWSELPPGPECPMHPFSGDGVAFSHDQFVREAGDAMAATVRLRRTMQASQHLVDAMAAALQSSHEDRRVRAAGAPGLEAVHGCDENRQRDHEGTERQIDPVA